MTISYNSLNCSSVGFEIVSRSSGCALDLGLAFINIPLRVCPALMIHHSPAAANESKLLKVSMEYYSGAWIPGKSYQNESILKGSIQKVLLLFSLTQMLDFLEGMGRVQ